MTVLVGIYCTDGVVVGADQAATFTYGAMRLMEQTVRTKLTIINDRIIVATTGAVGLGQRFAHHVGQVANHAQFPALDHHVVATEVSRITLDAFQKTFVPHHGQTGWGFGALLALPVQDSPELFEYDPVGFQPERKTDLICAVSLGSGQMLADPFLGFIRRVFWRDRLPSLGEGIFGALWALRHTIELNPGGVGGRPQLATLTRDGQGDWRARVLSHDELGEYDQHCELIEDHLRSYRIESHAPNGSTYEDVPVPSRRG